MITFKYESQIEAYEVALLEYVEKYGLSDSARIALSRNPSAISSDSLAKASGGIRPLLLHMLGLFKRTLND